MLRILPVAQTATAAVSQAAPVVTTAPDSPKFFTWLYITAALVSIALVFATHYWWDWIDDKLQRRARWIIASAVLTFICGVVLTVTIDTATPSDIWEGKANFWRILAALTASILGLWSLLINAVHAGRSDTQLRNNEKLLAEAVRFEKEHRGISKAFLQVVGVKWDRVRNLLRKSKRSQVTPTAFLKALNPNEQIQNIVVATYNILASRIPADQMLQVVVFHKENDYLLPLIAFNGAINTPGMQEYCLTHKTFFEMNTTHPRSVAVWCARNNRIKIVTDPKKAHADPEDSFSWIVSAESDRIRSLAGIPLGYPGTTGEPDFVLIVWTDFEGCFADTDRGREFLRVLGENVAHRLLFECDILLLIGRLKGKGLADASNDDTNSTAA